MSFDEQIQRAFETLTGRLRDEIARELGGLADELVASAAKDRDLAATEAANDARADAERAADARVAEAENAALARVAEAERAAAARVTEAERAAAAHQAAAVAAAESAAAARAREATDEQSRQAIDGAVAAARADMRTADLAASERLLDAVRAIDRARSLSDILDALVGAAGREAARAAILLVRGSKLGGWRFTGFGPAFDAAPATDLSFDQTGVIGEAVRSGASASSDAPGRLTSPPFDLPAGRARIAVPIPLNGQVVAALYADQGLSDAAPHGVAWKATLELLARHAARSLEALTAFQAARALTEAPIVTAPHDSAGDDEAARRYARLLVSEIKLYHETAVLAGRRERDLGTRLGAEIARARTLYEQRVPAQARLDHFHEELVRTLANGDAKLLGQTS